VRDIINMVVVLGLICAVSGLALSGVYTITKEPIELSRLKNVKEPAVKTVLKGYDNDPIKDRVTIPVGKDKYGRPVNLIAFPAKKGGKTFAVAFESSDKGYGGPIDIMVGLDVDKTSLTGISILKHSETPGLGARIVEDDFRNSFVDQSLEKDLSVDDIDAISGATFSSKGVVGAVNKARTLYEKYKDQMVK
jgi:electron transport complex protein RnfG